MRLAARSTLAATFGLLSQKAASWRARGRWYAGYDPHFGTAPPGEKPHVFAPLSTGSRRPQSPSALRHAGRPCSLPVETARPGRAAVRFLTEPQVEALRRAVKDTTRRRCRTRSSSPSMGTTSGTATCGTTEIYTEVDAIRFRGLWRRTGTMKSFLLPLLVALSCAQPNIALTGG